jgi:hypothetical protein
MRKSHKELQSSISPDVLLAALSQRFQQLTDHRAANVSASLKDVLMSGFAMFSLKYPSLLQFDLQTSVEKQNLRQLYNIDTLCSDSQMRRVLDKVDPDLIKEIFVENVEQLKKVGLLKEYQHYKDFLVVPIDGVTHFESSRIHCDLCTTKKQRDGTISYSHAMLCAMLVHPRQKEVFVLATEPIICQDGVEKNDCERMASKRILDYMSTRYKGEKLLITEDALYSNAPNIKQIVDNNWAYVLGIKPDGNKSLFSYFDPANANPRIREVNCFQLGNKFRLKYINNLPLNASHPEVRVNVLICEQEDKKGKVTKFSWVTNVDLKEMNLMDIMRIGRSRWKIENETFNTLKNQGYHFDHNYGHGEKNLSTVLAYLMLLAFSTDQLLQRCNRLFGELWRACGTKVKLWQYLRALFITTIFDSFYALYFRMACLLEIQIE